MRQEFKEVDVYDLDGTLTHTKGGVNDTTSGLATYALWNTITDALVGNAKEFEDRAAQWKQEVQHHADKVQSSKEMTEVGLSMFKPENQSAEALQREAGKLAAFFLQHGLVQIPAIQFLAHRIQSEVLCIISTASYEDGAIGFIRGISDARPDLLPKALFEKIRFVGTTVDWQSLKVTHMNADQGKIAGLEGILGQPLAEFRPKIACVFGDDPEINDRALLELGRYSFAIYAAKNQRAAVPANCVWSSWESIFENRAALGDYHAACLSSKAKAPSSLMWKAESAVASSASSVPSFTPPGSE